MLGTIVELQDRGKLTLGVVVKADGKRLIVLTRRGRKISSTSAKILHATGIATGRDSAAAMRQFADEVEQIGAEVDLEPLWDLCADEDRSIDLLELAELHFTEPGPAERSALLRALLQDTLCFRRRDDRFEPRSRKDVERVVETRRQEREAQERRASAAEWLAQGGGGEGPPESAQRHIDQLLEYAAQGEGYDKVETAHAVLVAAGVAADKVTQLEAFKLLVRAGVVSEHENLLLRRHRWRCRYPEAVVEDAERIAREPPPDGAGRRDWPGEGTIAIDAPTTREVDDAVELLESGPGGWRIAVHIANPSRFIAPGSPVDKEAQRRIVTLYLPDRAIPMLPRVLAHSAASLIAGEPRPTLSFVFSVGRDGTVSGLDVVRTRLQLGRRMSYEAANEAASDATHPLCQLLAAAAALREARAAAGGMVTSAPELSLRVQRDGTVKVQAIDQSLPGRRLVSELMVAANTAVAAMLRDERIPALFRVQRREAPKEGAEPPTLPDPRAPYDPVKAFQMTALLSRAGSSLAAERHAGLGVRAYVQVTSPLRRYVDLVLHRQLAAHVSGEPLPYGEEQLRELGRRHDERTTAARSIEATGVEYWFLRWFDANAGMEVNGVVTQERDDRVRVELVDFGWRTTMRARRRMPVGSVLRLVVRGADPRGGRVFLREKT